MVLRFVLFSLFSFLLSVMFSVQAFSAPPPPEAFGRLPTFYDASLSPDGEHIAVIINVEGTYYVRVLKKEGKYDKKKLVQLSKGVKPLWLKWANNHQVLTAFWQSETIDGTKITTGYIHSLNVNTLKGRILIRPPKGVFRQYNHRIIDWLEHDPDHVLMAYSNFSQNKSPDLFRVNVATGRAKRVEKSLPNIQHWVTDHRGEARVIFGQKDNAEGTAIMRLRGADLGEWQDVSNYPGLTADTAIFGFTSNLEEMVIGDYHGRDTLGLYVYDLSKKALGRKIYHNDDYDVSGIVLSANGEDIVGAQFVSDTEETVIIDGGKGMLDRMRDLYKGYQVDYIDQSQSGDTLLFKISHPYDPGNLMMVERGQTPVNLGDYYGDLEPEDLGIVISIKYTARDGQSIPAYVTLPPVVRTTEAIKNLPFIIMPHGGPYARDNKRFDYFAQFFATRGYGVLQMNFRGSEGYGKAFEEAGRENWNIMQEDVQDGAKFLIKKGYADPSRLCIAGWSFGGYAALLGAAKNHDLYSCAISMAGLTDIPSFVKDRKRYQFGKSASRKFILNGFEDKHDIKENSPYRIAEDIKMPLFLAHGEADQRVYYTQYKKMKWALKKSPAKVTYMSFKDEDHFLSNQDNRIKFFKGLDRFLVEANGKSEFTR